MRLWDSDLVELIVVNRWRIEFDGWIISVVRWMMKLSWLMKFRLCLLDVFCLLDFLLYLGWGWLFLVLWVGLFC